MTLLGENTLDIGGGTVASAGNVGCVGIDGTGTAVGVSGGLLPGFASRVRVTNQRRMTNAVAGTSIFSGFTFAAPSGNPSVNADFFRLTASGVNNTVAGLTMTAAGKIQLLNGFMYDGTTRPATDKSYSDTRIWNALHLYDGVAHMQYLWLFREKGKLDDHIIGTCGTSTVNAHYYGVINSSAAWVCDFQDVRWADERLYFGVNADRHRLGGFSASRVAVAVQIQGGSHARMTTTGPVYRVSDAVALNEHGWAVFVVEDLPAASTPTHTWEVLTASGWQPVGDPVASHTLAQVTL